MSAYHIHYYRDTLQGLWHASEHIDYLPKGARKATEQPIEVWTMPVRGASWAKIHRGRVDCPKGWLL